MRLKSLKIDPQIIIFSILGKKGSYKIENADWGGQIGRNYYLWAGVNCASWAVVYPGSKFFLFIHWIYLLLSKAHFIDLLKDSNT